MKRTQARPDSAARAFSLVEMLVAVCILGILLSLAITHFGGEQRKAMEKVRNRRNAQEIASLTMGAEAAGAPIIAAGDMKATIENLMEGRQATHGTFSGRIFRLGRLSEHEVAGAMAFLEWQHGMPAYVYGQD